MLIAYIDCLSKVSIETLHQALINAPFSFPRVAHQKANVLMTDLTNLLRKQKLVVTPKEKHLLEQLFERISGLDQVMASPIPCNQRTLSTKTISLLKNIPLKKVKTKKETISPLGAALMASMVDHFGESQLQKIEAVGEADGLRVLIGEGFPVLMVEATIDDMNPQLYDYIIERLFEAGAVDVTLQPIQMKKNRPAILLSCQSPWEKKDKICDLILKETTTFGVRYYPVERKVLTRELKTIATKVGKIRFKIGKDEKGNIIKQIPEYEDVKRIASSEGVSCLKLYQSLFQK